MFDLLKDLCKINGTSGRENKVREYIIKNLENEEYFVDPLGNLIIEVKGKKRAKNKVMICAHTDEVGVIATYITKNGLIKFSTVGGINPAVLSGRKVIFENETVGVIGIKPVHLCSDNEKNSLPSASDLYIDIGASSREQAQKYVSPGDSAVFSGEYKEIGEKILSKALDDRIGCAVMLKMIKDGPEFDTVFVFAVQEEVGLRGAGVAANRVNPDYAIVLEATTAADIAEVTDEKRVCVQNEGAVLSFMDNSTMYDRDIFKTALDIAKEKNISAQVKTAVAGGNDSGIIHKSAGGIKTCAISVPCRYIHSASCVVAKNDIISQKELTQNLCAVLANADI